MLLEAGRRYDSGTWIICWSQFWPIWKIVLTERAGNTEGKIESRDDSRWLGMETAGGCLMREVYYYIIE
jgi:hypothetical protein